MYAVADLLGGANVTKVRRNPPSLGLIYDHPKDYHGFQHLSMGVADGQWRAGPMLAEEYCGVPPESFEVLYGAWGTTPRSDSFEEWRRRGSTDWAIHVHLGVARTRLAARTAARLRRWSAARSAAQPLLSLGVDFAPHRTFVEPPLRNGSGVALRFVPLLSARDVWTMNQVHGFTTRPAPTQPAPTQPG